MKYKLVKYLRDQEYEIADESRILFSNYLFLNECQEWLYNLRLKDENFAKIECVQIGRAVKQSMSRVKSLIDSYPKDKYLQSHIESYVQHYKSLERFRYQLIEILYDHMFDWSKPIPPQYEAIKRGAKSETQSVLKLSVNKFNSIPTRDIVKYFQLHLVKSRLMKLEDAQKFLDIAFAQKRSREDTNLKISSRKGELMAVFKYFYDRHGEYNNTEKYVKLLVDNIDGFSFDNVYSNWNKEIVKIKRRHNDLS